MLKEKVQGERPVVLVRMPRHVSSSDPVLTEIPKVGSSLGALALFEAIIALSTTESSTPLIDTAIFISLPITPSSAEWLRIRRVVSRRVVNAYCRTDLVLAGVGRLHEVLGDARIGTMAGMGEVTGKDGEDLGVENVDLGTVISGAFVDDD